MTSLEWVDLFNKRCKELYPHGKCKVTERGSEKIYEFYGISILEKIQIEQAAEVVIIPQTFSFKLLGKLPDPILLADALINLTKVFASCGELWVRVWWTAVTEHDFDKDKWPVRVRARLAVYDRTAVPDSILGETNETPSD